MFEKAEYLERQEKVWRSVWHWLAPSPRRLNFAFSPGRAHPEVGSDGLQNPAPFLLPHHGFPDMLRACRAC